MHSWRRLAVLAMATAGSSLAAVMLVQSSMTELPAVVSIVQARQLAMKDIGERLRNLRRLPPEDAVASLSVLLGHFAGLADHFPEGSITADSDALPTIWDNWGQFQGFIDEAELVSAAMIEGARTGNPYILGTGERALAHTCYECHSVFRRTGATDP